MTNPRLSADQIREWYERHGPALVAYASGFVSDVSLAEDVVHGVFERLLRGDRETPENAAGYLYRAVRNAALNSRRDTSRVTGLEESCFVHRGGNREAALALQKSLASLPEEQREIVIMKTWGGLTLEESAAALQISPNTAASRYRYALNKLREQLLPNTAERATTSRRQP